MKLFKHPLKETFKQYLLRFKSFKRYLSKPKGSHGIIPPLNYKKVFYEDFSGGIDSNKWRLGQPWGNFHPDYLYQHYDLTGNEVHISKENTLILGIKHRPLDVVKSELPLWRQTDDLQDNFTIPYSVGMVTSKDSWKYGWFSAEIKLPKGTPLWPAFWLCGEHTWPPEIDIFEAYSKNGSLYQGKFLFKDRDHVKIQPNLHYGIVEEGTKTMYGAYDVPVWDATDRFIQYACWWERDFIRIYYDGLMIFECTNPDVLQWFNVDLNNQFIVIGNGIQYDKEIPTKCNMEVRNVSVYQKS